MMKNAVFSMLAKSHTKIGDRLLAEWLSKPTYEPDKAQHLILVFGFFDPVFITRHIVLFDGYQKRSCITHNHIKYNAIDRSSLNMNGAQSFHNHPIPQL